MLRIPLRDLEEATNNPEAYREKLLQPSENRFGRTYANALRSAIFKFHRLNNDLSESKAYLENYLRRWSTDSLKQTMTIENLEWYADDFLRRGWPIFENRLRVVVPQTISSNLRCSGEATRLDIVPSGGYAAWVTKASGADSIFDELRMRLIQYTVANEKLSVPIHEVQVGVYSFEERFIQLHTYSIEEINQAYMDFEDLIQRLGV